MEAGGPGRHYTPLQPAYYPFLFHEMTTVSPNIEMMDEQQALQGVLEPNSVQEHVQAATKGRKRKNKPTEPKKPAAKTAKSTGKQGKITDTFKVKRKVDRFNGVSEAELLTKTLPDILTFNLDIVIIGINPGLMAAYKGHHYPGPGNHFWKCLFLAGLSEQQLNHMDDHTLPHRYGIGFTNMVERTTPGSKDLSSKDFREGGRILVQKLQKYQPKIAVFNGKCIYDIFSKEIFGVKVKKLEFGLQPHKVPDTETLCYVMPSSSARCAQFPRAQDKVHYYIKLKELRDQLKGIILNAEIQEVDYTFDLQLAQEDAKKMAVKEEKYDPGYEAAYGGTHSEQAASESEPCNFSSNGTGIQPFKDLKEMSANVVTHPACSTVIVVRIQPKISTDRKKDFCPWNAASSPPTATQNISRNAGPAYMGPVQASYAEYSSGSSFGDVPNGQWMTQSFTEQIPEFNKHRPQEEQENTV